MTFTLVLMFGEVCGMLRKQTTHDGPLGSPDQSLNKGAFLLESRATISILFFVSGKYIPASNVPSTLLVMAFSIIVSVARLSVP
jgi:hypothetical protein